tara:strand:+ start:16071 stop:16298 length:228 start_codon:yes stop_codon:yes gene_type:complete
MIFAQANDRKWTIPKCLLEAPGRSERVAGRALAPSPAMSWLFRRIDPEQAYPLITAADSVPICHGAGSLDCNRCR